MHSRKI